MDIGEAFSFIEYLANKSISGGYIPASQRTMLAQRAEIEFVSKYYNNPKQYQRGSKTPVYGYADTQRIVDNLRPYLKSAPLTLLKGTADLPSDYLHPIGFFAQYTRSKSVPVDSLDCGDDVAVTTIQKTCTVQVQILTHDKFGFRLNSEIKPPTLEYPIVKFEGSMAIFAPQNTTSPQLDYIRKPTGAIYSYTQTGSEKPVFNPTKSKNWEAPEDCHNELCQMVLEYIGVHVSGQMITEFARYKEQTGI